jgi:hypothetical protein
VSGKCAEDEPPGETGHFLLAREEKDSLVALSFFMRSLLFWLAVEYLFFI